MSDVVGDCEHVSESKSMLESDSESVSVSVGVSGNRCEHLEQYSRTLQQMSRRWLRGTCSTLET